MQRNSYWLSSLFFVVRTELSPLRAGLQDPLDTEVVSWIGFAAGL
jgi:hypothetical protein